MTALCQFRTVCLTLILCAGCEQRMDDQPRYEALEASALFPHDQAARHPPANTVARGEPRVPDQPPDKVTREDLERGQQRYRIYCTPCHGELGHGRGPVVGRGFPAPPSYHSERLRRAPLRHFYEVIRDGRGKMYSYADRVNAADRWRIALYIRALQYSAPRPLQSYNGISAPLDNVQEKMP